MKNKGYTLLELLGVIVILSVLVTLVFPSVINFIKKGDDTKNSITNELIMSAAEDYINDNSSNLYLTSGAKHCVSIEALIGENYLDKSLIEDDLYISKSIKVTYTDKYNYEIMDTDTCMILEPGLYGEHDILLVSWDELVNDYGFDIENTDYYNNVTDIIEQFDNASKLVISDKVETIGLYAFRACSNLTEITIPESVTSIDATAFDSCEKLETINYNKENVLGYPWGAPNATVISE